MRAIGDLSIDEAHAFLHERGWSVGESAAVYSHGRVWFVTCQQDSEAFTAEEATQTEAWRTAAATVLLREN